MNFQAKGLAIWCFYIRSKHKQIQFAFCMDVYEH
jgi:hypothetical protein